MLYKASQPNLLNIFERQNTYNLKLNARKCLFLKPEVLYLGFLFTDKGVKTDASKGEAVRTSLRPTKAEDKRRIIAFSNYYRRCIPTFALIARCLNTLLRKRQPFIWSKQCEKAFSTLKDKLINPPILQYQNFDTPFVLTTDASALAHGTILSQSEIGHDFPIAYACKAL